MALVRNGAVEARIHAVDDDPLGEVEDLFESDVGLEPDVYNAVALVIQHMNVGDEVGAVARRAAVKAKLVDDSRSNHGFQTIVNRRQRHVTAAFRDALKKLAGRGVVARDNEIL